MDTGVGTDSLHSCVIVIPALDPDGVLPAYVQELLDRGAAAVLVVNDGSGADSAPVFAALSDLKGCTVLAHGENRGKGRALKTAFAYIAGAAGWAGLDVVTADADGQHQIADVCAVARALARGEGGIVMGVRDLTLPGVPPKSKAGNRLTSWAFHALYGARLADTQTGLRGIPHSLLDWCGGIAGERFEYEMNMLIRAARERVPILQVPIATIYYNGNAGTHLHPIRDSWRVFVILVSGLGWYTAAAVLSAVTDVAAFALCDGVVFALLPPLWRYWWSVLLARALSSALNYTLNRRYVFGARPRRRTLIRYYCLWACQLAASYLLLLVLSALLPGIYPVVNKAMGDIILAICSYQIQMHWVFREEAVHEAG